MWLQCTFVFSLLWGIAATITGTFVFSLLWGLAATITGTFVFSLLWGLAATITGTFVFTLLWGLAATITGTFVFSLLWGLAATITGTFVFSLLWGLAATITGTFVFSLLWGLLRPSLPKSFKLTKSQLFGDKDTVFDYVYDKRNNGTWIPWMELEKEAPLPPNAKVNDLIILTNENACLRYFVTKMVRSKIPILLVGPTGTGKSSLKEVYGAQPPLELIRQWIDHGHWYDLKEMVKQEVVDVLFVSAMLPPGGGSNLITTRLTRHTLLITLDSFEDNTLNKIFVTIMDWHFSKGFSENMMRQSKTVVAATMDVYKNVTVQFLPTPSKCHYLFNLRDFARVIKGVLLVPSTHMKEINKLVLLWVHETYRVVKLFEIVYKAVYGFFRVHMDQVMTETGYVPEGEKLSNKHASNIFFGNYMEPDADPKIYDQVTHTNNNEIEYF
ncbi:hypothetical protein MSG28_003843 [Choristoneura fumiferana]|uniref:Uncharacterized protein n=1 Tax=Choristoneura fumiferana TaxID=7141 RepID=A0ACC0KGR4_CHOFU|nr:hypothetical protein MSG28_003843 [Choristoneura fumiferana]